ncbi:TetR/AcrR family transcriptional regulator [Streptomyces griseoaurantiacus]|uniref:TetR/AcrR family transcriptional regulator n=1 Tax=Streptomyces griseoaurantiacus TaxID=68213 RepID=A0ABZ1V8T0_9ACTN|nr:TetR family transcriptional regulator [Streptomyces jietaisiensis]
MGEASGPGRVELTVLGQAPVERADAARNRRRILDAASRLLAEQGPEAVTMNAVAAAAGMGVGTVYRRFGDVATLLLALLDHREQQFQEAFLDGPAPLGPGAPPADRLRAFLYALTDHIAAHRTVMLAAETASPMALYRSAAYVAWHAHVSMLLHRTRPEADEAVLAHLLLAPFGPGLIRHLSDDRGTLLDEFKAAVDHLLGMCLPVRADGARAEGASAD